MKKIRILFILFVYVVTVVSCNSDYETTMDKIDSSLSGNTRSIITAQFDWENADWMPTPANQVRIPSPWVGQGSLASTVGIDVLNDRKAADGWVLLYNSFDVNMPQLINPYFILYNKYRGLMRIYLYVTTQFVASSSYIQDGLSIVSNKPTTMLNFLGEEVIDPSTKKKSYLQIQPAPYDGSYPLASNKWYMLQYELAYDSEISNIPYNQIQLSWLLNYCDISRVRISGEQNGTLNGTIGVSGNSSDNVINKLSNFGSGVGTVVLASIGKNFVDHNAVGTDGSNKMGLAKGVFQSISKGIASGLSAAAGNLPSAGIAVLNALIGGGSNATPISLTLKTKIELEGNISSNGSFPSMPISFWIPGTSIPSDAIGYLPNYNKPLGVINFDDKADITLCYDEFCRKVPDEPFDPDYTTEYTELAIYPYSLNVDYSSHLIINPEVSSIADVVILKQDILLVEGVHQSCPSGDVIVSCSREHPFQSIHDNRGGSFGYDYMVDLNKLKAAVKMTIRVSPKDGSPSSLIIKTFLIGKPKWVNYYYEVNGWGTSRPKKPNVNL